MRTKTSLLILLLTSLLLSLAAQCQAPTPASEAGPVVSAAEAYANITPQNGAVYLTLTNHGDHPDELVGVSADRAETTELHQTVMDENEVMRMQPVERLELPAGESVRLAPGGLHLMLLQPDQSLAEGDTISLTLTFAQAEPLTIQAEVRQGGAMAGHVHDEAETMDHQAEADHPPAKTHADEAETHHDDEADPHGEAQTGAAPKEGVPMEALTPVSLAEGEPLRVIATTTIVGDLTRRVAGDLIELRVLLPPAVDPHTFAPTPQDAAAVADAHLVVMNGLGLEQFLHELLENAGGEAPLVSLAQGVELRRLSPAEHAPHAEAAESGEPDDHGHEAGQIDPHIWLSPANAQMMVHNLAEALSRLDPAQAETYRANAQAYQAELADLDGWIESQIETIPAENRELVTDHDSLGYYADRYGLEVVGAVIPAFSTSAEPSAQELARLQDAIAQTGARAVFVSSAVNPTLASRVAEDTGAQLVPLYTGSLSEPGGPADSYLDYMRYNTTAIVEALGQ